MNGATTPRAPLTREAIVAEARRMVSEEGLDNFSLRRLATRLGVTAPALYAHVSDRDDLLTAVADAGFRDLIARYGEVEAADPLDRLRELGRVYVRHAVAEPELFRLMFLFRPGGLDVPAVEYALESATEAFDAAVNAVGEAIEAGVLREEHDPLTTALILWTASHGAATVLLMGMELDPPTRAAVSDGLVDAVLAGLAPGSEGEPSTS